MLRFRCLSFDELTLTQLYQIMVLRQRVFVVEQDCVYLDADGKDPDCRHVVGYRENGDLGAYARIVPPGYALGHSPFDQSGRAVPAPAIGRIVTAPEVRGQGFGRAVVRESLRFSEQLYGRVPIKIQAQEYLLGFYKSFGFRKTSETYLEDGIPHLDMERPGNE